MYGTICSLPATFEGFPLIVTPMNAADHEMFLGKKLCHITIPSAKGGTSSSVEGSLLMADALKKAPSGIGHQTGLLKSDFWIIHASKQVLIREDASSHVKWVWCHLSETFVLQVFHRPFQMFFETSYRYEYQEL